VGDEQCTDGVYSIISKLYDETLYYLLLPVNQKILFY
jgi:hypothetical protein